MAAAAEGVHRVHGYRMTFYAPEPLDVYLSKNRTADGLPFYNTNYACGNPRTGENSDTLMKALEDYCEKEDNKFYEIWRAYKAKGELWSSWQQGQLGNATMDESVDQLKEMVQKRGIGQRRKPVVLYRAYAYGFDTGETPRVGSDYFPESYRSFSLSYQFAHQFRSLKRHPQKIIVRLDVLPGIDTLIPVLEYNHGGVWTEFEVIVPSSVRVHVFHPNQCHEGRTNMPFPPLISGCPGNFVNDIRDTERMQKVAFFFVISVPGTTVEYFPDYTSEEEGAPLLMSEQRKARVKKNGATSGGGRGLILTDNNCLGIGKVPDIIEPFIDEFFKLQMHTKQKKTHLDVPAFSTFGALTPFLKVGGRLKRRPKTIRRFKNRRTKSR